MKIYFATSNKGKIENARMALKPFGIEVEQADIELMESRAEDSKDIALEKAQQAYAQFKKPLIVEDSGFYIRALGGFPMTHIKFSLKTLGIDNILKMMKGAKDRQAEWRMTIAYVYGHKQHKTFTFIEKGLIASKPRPVKRQMMSDYWRIYVPTMAKNKKALSELTEESLEKWHDYYNRNNQFQMFGKWLKKNG